MTLAFQHEIEAFERKLPELLEEHLGEYVVFKDCEVRQVCPSFDAALSWGYDHYGLDQQFFVKEVAEEDHSAHYRRSR